MDTHAMHSMNTTNRLRAFLPLCWTFTFVMISMANEPVAGVPHERGAPNHSSIEESAGKGTADVESSGVAVPGSLNKVSGKDSDEAAAAFRLSESYRETEDFDRADLFLRLAILRSNGDLRFVERYRDSILQRGCRPQDCAAFADVVQQLLLTAPLERVETYLSYIEELEKIMPVEDEQPYDESEPSVRDDLPPLDIRVAFDPDNGKRILDNRMDQLLSDDGEIKEEELERCRAALSLHGLFLACRENLVRAESAIEASRLDNPSVDSLFDRLSSQEIVAPLAGAQQQIGAMFLFPTNLFDDTEGKIMLESVRRQESFLSEIVRKTDEARSDAIQGELKRMDATIEDKNASLTKRIDVLKSEIDFIVRHLPFIGSAPIAEQLLSAQSDRVKRLHALTTERHAKYQHWAMGELKKAIDTQDRDRKDGNDKFEKAKSALMDYLARIDRSLLVAEVNEMYQDVYRRAMDTISKHLEDKEKRGEKADFLTQFLDKKKKRLEDF